MDTMGTAIAWIALMIASFILAAAISILYTAVAGTPPKALSTLLVSPAICAVAGFMLQAVRALIVTGAISRVGRGQDWEPDSVVDWLLAPRDTDLLVQLAFAFLFVVVNT